MGFGCDVKYPNKIYLNSIGTKKEPINKALNLNGGKNASYIEPFIMELKEQLIDKTNTNLIHLLKRWNLKKIA